MAFIFSLFFIVFYLAGVTSVRGGAELIVDVILSIFWCVVG